MVVSNCMHHSIILSKSCTSPMTLCIVHNLQAHRECVDEAKHMLQMPPVLVERSPRGAVIEVDEKLAEAIETRVIFTDTTQHKEDKV